MEREPNLQLTWLRDIGFSRGNPFTTREASGEASALVQYFVLRPGFGDVVGSARQPRSALLCARRGAGKTTSRLALELQCRAGQMDAPVLPVSYVDFERPLGAAGAPEWITPTHHTDEIVRLGLLALFDALAERPERAVGFVGGLRRQLVAYLSHYTDRLDDVGLDEWLAGRGMLSETCQAEALRRGAVPSGDTFLRFLAGLLGAERAALLPAGGPTETFAAFLRLARRAGFESVYVLIDRVDEQEPMAGDPEQAAALVAPLVGDLVLMDVAHAAFKFFITPEVLAALSARLGRAFRPDRLVVRDISWDVAALQELLDRRVSVFSDGLLPSLDAVAEMGGVTAQLAAAADGSPRDLLRLAEWLLFWQYQRAGSTLAFTLTAEDVARAIESFGREREAFAAMPAEPPTPPAPPAAPAGRIRIDEAGEVWVGARRVGHLSKMRARLLRYLLANEGRVLSYDQIGQALYDENWTLRGMTNDSVDGLVKHVRAALALGPAASEVIRKVPDEGGYVFRQPEAGDGRS